MGKTEKQINNMEEKTTEITHEPQSAKEMLVSVAIGVGLIVLSVFLMKKAVDVWKG